MSARLIAIADEYEQATADLEQQVLDRIYAAFDASLRETRRQIQEVYPRLQSLQDSGQLTILNRQALIAQELAEFQKLLKPEQADQVEALTGELLQLSTENGQRLAEVLTREIDPRYPIAAFSRVPIEAVAAQARDFRERLFRYSDQQASLISATVEQGLTLGWGTQKTAGQLNALGVSFKSNAESVARTETMAAYNRGAQDRYERSGIGFIQVVATPSEGLCNYCSARNGKVYKLGDVSVPYHVRCRCTCLPWSEDWQKQGLTDDTFFEQYRERLIDEVKQNGGTPDNGLAPFEKGKLEQPPQAVWAPGQGPMQTAPPKSEPPPKPKAKPVQQPTEAEPTLTARQWNAKAIPDLTATEFRAYLQDKEFLAAQAAPESPWNQSLEQYLEAGGAKSRYKTDIVNAIAVGNVPAPEVLDALKLNKSQLAQVEANRAALAEREKQTERIAAAINTPLMSAADSAGWKTRMSKEEAAAYTKDSYFGSTEFWHGNRKEVVDSIANEGAMPERNTRGIYGQGVYLGVEKGIGELYARSAQGDIALISAVVKAKNPYIATTAEMAELGANFSGDQSNGVDGVAVNQFLRAKGYDSVYLKDYGYAVAFEQRQVVTVSYEDVTSKREELTYFIDQQTGVDRVAASTNGGRFLKIENSENVDYRAQMEDEDEDDFF